MILLLFFSSKVNNSSIIIFAHFFPDGERKSKEILAISL